MKIRSRFFDSLLIASFSVSLVNGLTGCGTTASSTVVPAEALGVKFTAVLDTIAQTAPSGHASRLESILGLDLPFELNRSGESLVTPSSYKIALVNFWLLKSDGTQVNVINPDEANPTYTESRPLILDFSQVGAARELFSSTTFTAGTYSGYKMQFLYLEMKLPTAFHVPNTSWETDFTDTTVLNAQTTRNFRLYFNTIGKYWKRDFVVEMVPDSGKWFWLRRQVENTAGYKTFFLSVDDNDHPGATCVNTLVGGHSSCSGTQSTIDLFADDTFWGTSETYDDTNGTPIIVGTHSTAGGVNAVLPASFTIPEKITEFFNVDITIDIAGTMQFGEQGTAPSGVTFYSSTLDLGPGYGADFYGDQGLHPMMPAMSVAVTNGTTDAHASAPPAFQVPQACVTGGWLEPVLCNTNYCAAHATDAFCVAFAKRSEVGTTK